MTLRVSEHEQGTPEWLQERLGLITASQVKSLISGTGKPSTSAKGYIDTIIAELLMGEPEETYQSAAMLRGIELEPEARRWVELQRDYDVSESGLLIRDDLGVACSPDGLIDGYQATSGGLEIKCLIAKNHVAALRSGKMLTEYIPQVQCSMWVTDRAWWDFCCYHPTMPKLLIRVQRDQEYIDKMATEVAKARAVIEKSMKEIQEKYA